jgi:hypothetical protein
MLSPSHPHRYHVCGFALKSDIDFSELLNHQIAKDGLTDIDFCIGELPSIGEGLTFRRNKFGFTAIAGHRVVISASASAPPQAVRRTVLTGGLNAIAYQRGLLPLHASAVAVGERCVAFCGGSETGKSSIAAAFAQAGYPFLCDDLVIVHTAPDGSPVVWPGVLANLTKQSMDLVGGEITAITPFAEWDLKAVVQTGEASNYAPSRLACIYLLDWGEPSIRRLSPLQAATILSRCLRNPAWLGPAGTATTIRQRWIDLASRVSIIAITRRREASTFLALCEFLISSWKQDRLGSPRTEPSYSATPARMCDRP